MKTVVQLKTSFEDSYVTTLSRVFCLVYFYDVIWICCRTRDLKTPLQLAIKEGLVEVAESLCTRGADVDVIDPNSGDCPLWQALESAQPEIASILVLYTLCDTAK